MRRWTRIGDFALTDDLSETRALRGLVSRAIFSFIQEGSLEAQDIRRFLWELGHFDVHRMTQHEVLATLDHCIDIGVVRVLSWTHMQELLFTPASAGGGAQQESGNSMPQPAAPSQRSGRPVMTNPRAVPGGSRTPATPERTPKPPNLPTPQQTRKAAVDKRMAELRSEGHGPQRHGPDVSTQQLSERAIEKKDPMTGTTTDGVNGGTHQCGKHATKINSAEAFVQADEHLRSSPDFEVNMKAANAVGDDRFVVERPLEEIYGPDYRSNVSGITRNGTNSYPTGNPPGSAPPSTTNFENGTMKAIYQKNATGGWHTYSMYPEPGR